MCLTSRNGMFSRRASCQNSSSRKKLDRFHRRDEKGKVVLAGVQDCSVLRAFLCVCRSEPASSAAWLQFSCGFNCFQWAGVRVCARVSVCMCVKVGIPTDCWRRVPPLPRHSNLCRIRGKKQKSSFCCSGPESAPSFRSCSRTEPGAGMCYFSPTCSAEAHLCRQLTGGRLDRVVVQLDPLTLRWKLRSHQTRDLRSQSHATLRAKRGAGALIRSLVGVQTQLQLHNTTLYRAAGKSQTHTLQLLGEGRHLSQTADPLPFSNL